MRSFSYLYGARNWFDGHIPGTCRMGVGTVSSQVPRNNSDGYQEMSKSPFILSVKE